MNFRALVFLPLLTQGQFLYNVSVDPNERVNLYGLEEYANIQTLLDERMAYFQTFEREMLSQEPYSAGTWTTYGAAVPWKDYTTPPAQKEIIRAVPNETAPHIVFIMVDDVGWSDVGYSQGGSGWAGFATPRIDELAASGVKLVNHYTSWVCGPSRSSFLTGRYSNRLGFASAPGGIPILPLDEVTMAQELQLLGYHTALVGKWHMGFEEWSYTPLFRGFDSFYGYYGGSIGYYSKMNQAAFLDLFDNMSPVVDSTELTGHLTEVLQTRVETLIQSHAGSESPLFLFYAMQNIHTGIMFGDEVFEAPVEYMDKCEAVSGEAGDYQQYICALLIMMDEAVGKTACAVQEYLGDRESLIVFASDNGGWGQMPGANYPHRGSKGSIVQGGIQNPAFMFGSAIPLSKHGSSYDGLMHLTDWHSIFLSLASGGTWNTSINGYEIDGHDVLPAILYDAPNPRKEVFHNRDIDSGSMQVGSMKYILGSLGGPTDPLVYYGLNGDMPAAVCELGDTPFPTIETTASPTPQPVTPVTLLPTVPVSVLPTIPVTLLPTIPVSAPLPTVIGTLRPCTFLDQLLGYTDCIKPE